MQIEKYEHHGEIVSVFSYLKGKHRERCLCYAGCKHFAPGAENHCEIASAVYANCVTFGILTPMWECPKYEAGG